MNYCINPEADEPIFLIDCQIGKDEENPDQPYIDGQAFVRELLYMDGEGKKRIWVWINSPGGNVVDGGAIYGAILKTKTKVNTFCYYEAASIAGVIFQAGYKRVMLESAKLMYHEAYSVDGKPSKSLDAVNGQIAHMISSRSWKDIELVKRMMAKTSYITAQEALDSDLCDSIEKNEELNTPTNRNLIREVIMNKSKILNKTISDTMTKTEAIKILNLKADASDADVIVAMTKAVELNKHTQAELDALKKKLDSEDDDDKYNALKKEFDAMKKDMDKNKEEEEEKKKAKECEDKKNAAKDKILNAIKERGATFTEKQIKNFVSLGGIDDKNLTEVITEINETPVVNLAPTTDAEKFEKDKGIVFKTSASKEFNMQKDGDEKSSTIVMKEVTDTSSMVAYMNKVKREKALKRFPGQND
jgi:ATP-dependent Clp protease protease subunit